MENKLEAMRLINDIIKDNNLRLSDYYNAEMECPSAIMVGCPKCKEYRNNGCGIAYFPCVYIKKQNKI